MSHTDVLFRDLHADDLPDITEIESLCTNCNDDGITKLLLTKIPFFREVIVASFSCEHCGFHNTSIDSAGRYQDKGVKIVLQVLNKEDMNRRIVLNKNSTISLPELDSTFPVTEGALTTIEGALTLIIDNISELQDVRKTVSPELAAQLDEFLQKMQDLVELKRNFIIELSDPSGNSVIENLIAPKVDPQLRVEYYKRSKEQNEALSIEDTENSDLTSKTYADEAQDEFKAKNEVVFFQDNCPNCNVPIECRMKMLDIPHFKEVIVMASSCDSCGNRENQVVGGCGIAAKGQRITLKVNEPADLTRDFLKSENAAMEIPELEFQTNPGTLGGRFTTVEGILRNAAEQLKSTNPFMCGDSATKSSSEMSLSHMGDQLQRIANGEFYGVTLIISDASGNSYIQDIYSPEVDPRLTVELYDRTEEENEDLGLNDMDTDKYVS